MQNTLMVVTAAVSDTNILTWAQGVPPQKPGVDEIQFSVCAQIDYLKADGFHGRKLNES